MPKSPISEGPERRLLDLANGRVPAVHPAQLGLVQIWIAWRHVQSEYHGSTRSVDFSADVGTTLMRCVNVLCGYIQPGHYHYGELVKWAWNANAAWAERGVPYTLWVVARPDLTFVAMLKRHGAGFEKPGVPK